MTRRSSDEAGWTTVWVLGLSMLLLSVGGISLDLWRAFAERRTIAAMADAAAVAGASGLDESALRSTGTLRLDPGHARQLARTSLATQPDGDHLSSFDVTATPDAVTVIARGRANLTLLRVVAGGEPLDVTVTSTARPRRSA